jgi:lipopolysaccharide transport system ATP-binding protein
MSQLAVRCEQLGKLYRIGRREPYKALRDRLGEIARAPAGWLGTAMGGGKSAEPDNDTIWALRDVSFEVRDGEVVGVIGRNGAGKTTLLRVLSRITEPSEGRAQIRGRVGSLLEVGTGFHPELTGRENILLSGAIMGMRRAEIRRKFDEIVAFAEVDRFVDTPVKRYSSGMYVRLAFAVAAHLEPEILLVDEVLAVGDAAFRKKCLAKMGDVAREGRTVLFVSHSMGAVSNLCGRGLVLERGGVAFNGRVHQAIDFYNHLLLSDSAGVRAEAPHIIFDDPDLAGAAGKDVAIYRVEILDVQGRPKPVVSTWDDVTFRIHYHAKQRVGRGSVAVEIRSLEGTRVLVLSTQPDGNTPLDLEAGSHAVDCAIRLLPLAAGDYLVGAGLAIPNAELLWYRADLGTLSVHPRDVYGSGLSPTFPRVLVAVQHDWRVIS